MLRIEGNCVEKNIVVFKVIVYCYMIEMEFYFYNRKENFIWVYRNLKVFFL